MDNKHCFSDYFVQRNVVRLATRAACCFKEKELGALLLVGGGGGDGPSVPVGQCGA